MDCQKRTSSGNLSDSAQKHKRKYMILEDSLGPVPVSSDASYKELYPPLKKIKCDNNLNDSSSSAVSENSLLTGIQILHQASPYIFNSHSKSSAEVQEVSGPSFRPSPICIKPCHSQSDNRESPTTSNKIQLPTVLKVQEKKFLSMESQENQMAKSLRTPSMPLNIIQSIKQPQHQWNPSEADTSNSQEKMAQKLLPKSSTKKQGRQGLQPVQILPKGCTAIKIVPPAPANSPLVQFVDFCQGPSINPITLLGQDVLSGNMQVQSTGALMTSISSISTSQNTDRMYTINTLDKTAKFISIDGISNGMDRSNAAEKKVEKDVYRTKKSKMMQNNQIQIKELDLVYYKIVDESLPGIDHWFGNKDKDANVNSKPNIGSLQSNSKAYDIEMVNDKTQEPLSLEGQRIPIETISLSSRSPSSGENNSANADSFASSCFIKNDSHTRDTPQNDEINDQSGTVSVAKSELLKLLGMDSESNIDELDCSDDDNSEIFYDEDDLNELDVIEISSNDDGDDGDHDSLLPVDNIQKKKRKSCSKMLDFVPDKDTNLISKMHIIAQQTDEEEKELLSGISIHPYLLQKIVEASGLKPTAELDSEDEALKQVEENLELVKCITFGRQISGQIFAPKLIVETKEFLDSNILKEVVTEKKSPEDPKFDLDCIEIPESPEDPKFGLDCIEIPESYLMQKEDSIYQPAIDPFKKRQHLISYKDVEEELRSQTFCQGLFTYADTYPSQKEFSMSKIVYGCFICSYCSDNSDDLPIHWETAHSQAEMFKCGSCGLAANSTSMIRRHYESEHPDLKAIAVLSNSAMYKEPLVFHLGSENPKTTKEVAPEFASLYLKKPSKSLSKENIILYRCKYCKFTSPTASVMRRHIRLDHYMAFPFVCANCHFCFGDGVEAKRHIEYYHSSDKSMKKLMNINHLDLKMSSMATLNLGLKAFRFNDMSTRLGRQSSITTDGAYSCMFKNGRIHMTCHRCQFESCDKQDMWWHIRDLHSEPSWVQCPKCTSTNLMSKQDLATCWRVCSCCQAPFVLYASIKKIPPFRTHEYICTECHFRSSVLKTMKKHVEKVHLKCEPFACGFCNFSASLPSTVKSHIKAEHPNHKIEIIKDVSEFYHKNHAIPSLFIRLEGCIHGEIDMEELIRLQANNTAYEDEMQDKRSFYERIYIASLESKCNKNPILDILLRKTKIRRPQPMTTKIRRGMYTNLKSLLTGINQPSQNTNEVQQKEQEAMPLVFDPAEVCVKQEPEERERSISSSEGIHLNGERSAPTESHLTIKDGGIKPFPGNSKDDPKHHVKAMQQLDDIISAKAKKIEKRKRELLKSKQISVLDSGNDLYYPRPDESPRTENVNDWLKDRVFVCSYRPCGAGVKKLRTLFIHLLIEHGGAAQFGCTGCNYNSNDIRDIKLKCGYKHGIYPVIMRSPGCKMAPDVLFYSNYRVNNTEEDNEGALKPLRIEDPAFLEYVSEFINGHEDKLNPMVDTNNGKQIDDIIQELKNKCQRIEEYLTHLGQITPLDVIFLDGDQEVDGKLVKQKCEDLEKLMNHKLQECRDELVAVRKESFRNTRKKRKLAVLNQELADSVKSINDSPKSINDSPKSTNDSPLPLPGERHFTSLVNSTSGSNVRASKRLKSTTRSKERVAKKTKYKHSRYNSYDADPKLNCQPVVILHDIKYAMKDLI